MNVTFLFYDNQIQINLKSFITNLAAGGLKPLAAGIVGKTQQYPLENLNNNDAQLIYQASKIGSYTKK